MTADNGGESWLDPGQRFGDYGVRRIGMRYEIHVEGSDGLVRPTYTGRYWRWITAARIAQAMWSAFLAGRLSTKFEPLPIDDFAARDDE